MGPLVEALLARVSDPMRDSLEATGDLQGKLDGVVTAAKRAWPSVVVEPTRFMAFIGDRLPEEGDASAIDALATDELYLVIGCIDGDNRAVAELHAHYLEDLAVAVRHLDKSGTLTDEVKQAVAEKMLVAPPGEVPRIADYTGRSPLRAWLKVIAVRTGLNLLRGSKKNTQLDDQRIEDAVDGLDIGYLKEKYRTTFRNAFAKAMESLDSRERSLLRMSIVDNLNSDQIGAFYNIHRATAARWVGHARSKLADQTKAHLTSSLRVDDAELDSIMRLVRSRIDLSVHRLLAVESVISDGRRR